MPWIIFALFNIWNTALLLLIVFLLKFFLCQFQKLIFLLLQTTFFLYFLHVSVCSLSLICFSDIFYNRVWWWWIPFLFFPRTSEPDVNTLRPRQNGRRFADDTFKRIFLDENVRISIKISLKFVPKGPINNNPALVQIMAWRRSGDKPLSEPIMVSLLTHICVTRPQWVNTSSVAPFREMTTLLVSMCLDTDCWYWSLLMSLFVFLIFF